MRREEPAERGAHAVLGAPDLRGDLRHGRCPPGLREDPVDVRAPTPVEVVRGGPGATGRSFSDEPTILRSIRDTLLALPDHTVVHTGHGDTTTIGAERDGVLVRAAELGL